MLRFGIVPTLLLNGVSRQAMAVSQQRLVQAQQELSTGRYFDIGLALGARTGSSIGLRLKLADVESSIDSSAQASVKADVVQDTLASVSELASTFLATLSGARGATQGQELARNAARSALPALTSLINASFDGQRLFGGLNTEMPPLSDYEGGALETAVDAAFLSTFGITQSDPDVSQITGPEMAAFLDGPYADLFAPDAWKLNWSAATDANLLVRAGGNSQLNLSSSANAPFVRKLAQSLGMMVGLGLGNLSQAAFEEAVDSAIQLLSEAQLEIGGEQSRIGLAQQALERSSLQAKSTKAATLQAISAIESIDPYEAAARVNTLMTQLESSYSVTGRISRMSLLNYI